MVVVTVGLVGSGSLRVKKYVAAQAAINTTAPAPRPAFIPREIVCLLDSLFGSLIVPIPLPLEAPRLSAQPIRLHDARPAAQDAKPPQSSPDPRWCILEESDDFL
jgi:hypothetical protein